MSDDINHSPQYPTFPRVTDIWRLVILIRLLTAVGLPSQSRNQDDRLVGTYRQCSDELLNSASFISAPFRRFAELYVDGVAPDGNGMAIKRMWSVID